MVNVAIAGGTGTVGRTLVEVLASQHKHQAITLSRKVSTENPTHAFSDSSTQDKALTAVFTVDYSDIDALKTFLEEHNIHTVICAFGITATSLATSQLNLIKAADASTSTKRFIPSSFAIPYPEDGAAILPPLEHYFTSLKALEATSLEWAVVHNGTFLDYFAPPAGLAGFKSYLPHSVLAVDMAHNAAAIPGDGNQPMTFTYTFDVARFVMAALDLEAWPASRELRVVGDEVTFNQLVAIAEEVKGSKFNVVYDGVEELRQSRISELPGHKASYDKYPKERLQWFLAIFEMWMATGQGRVSRGGTLNEMFPEIKPLTVRGMMERYWAPTK